MTLDTMPSDPIVEATFEIRFSCKNPAISSLLLGAITNSQLGNVYENVERLNVADIPLPIRRQDPNLRYAAEYRLSTERSSIIIGNAVVGVNVQRKYPGGAEFLKKINEVLKVVHSHSKLMAVQRVAFRYINLVEPENGSANDFDAINFEGTLIDRDLREQQTFLQVELNDGGYSHNVKLTNRSEVTNTKTNETHRGLLLDIDTSTTENLDDFWNSSADLLKKLRDSERSVFEAIMKPDALERYKNQ